MPPARAATARWCAHLVCAATVTLGACADRNASRSGEPIHEQVSFGEGGLAPGQFSYPRAIDADASSLWIIDKTARVQRLDPQTGDCLAWFTMPAFERGKPTGLTIAPGPTGQPALYIADTHEHRVLVFPLVTTLGEPVSPIASFGTYGDAPGQFIYPTDVAVLTDEQGLPTRIFVSEYGGNDRISIFGPGVLEGRDDFITSFGSLGSGPDQFNRPQSIALDADRGELVVADATNHRIGRFTLQGKLIAWIGSPDTAGRAPGSFQYPYGLTLVGDGTALIAEFGNHRIQHINLESGQSLGTYGTGGRGTGQLATPWGVVILDGLVYALDSGNNRIVGFRPRSLTTTSAKR